jgi:hypothetical protein
MMALFSFKDMFIFKHFIENEQAYLAGIVVGYFLLQIYYVYETYCKDMSNINFISKLRSKNMWLQYDNQELKKEIKKRDCIMRNLNEMQKKCRETANMIDDLKVDLYTDLFVYNKTDDKNLDEVKSI